MRETPMKWLPLAALPVFERRATPSDLPMACLPMSLQPPRPSPVAQLFHRGGPR